MSLYRQRTVPGFCCFVGCVFPWHSAPAIPRTCRCRRSLDHPRPSWGTIEPPVPPPVSLRLGRYRSSTPLPAFAWKAARDLRSMFVSANQPAPSASDGADVTAAAPLACSAGTSALSRETGGGLDGLDLSAEFRKRFPTLQTVLPPSTRGCARRGRCARRSR